jgi:hypothetical protein
MDSVLEYIESEDVEEHHAYHAETNQFLQSSYLVVNDDDDDDDNDGWAEEGDDEL